MYSVLILGWCKNFFGCLDDCLVTAEGVFEQLEMVRWCIWKIFCGTVQLYKVYTTGSKFCGTVQLYNVYTTGSKIFAQAFHKVSEG